MRIPTYAFAVALCLSAVCPGAFADEPAATPSAPVAEPIASGVEGAAAPAASVQIDAEKVRARYSRIVAFTADVEQEKKAPFLARPLKSQVSLSMKDGRIEWRTLKPVKSFLAIDSDGIHMEAGASSGAGEAMKNASKDPRAAAFIGFLRSLFALDFPGIEKDFALSFEVGAMKARPKPTSSLGAMIHGIDIHFAADLSIQKVVVETKDETTTLVFKSFVPVEKAE